MSDDEQSSKPRELIHRAQAECAQAIYELHLARMGADNKPVDEAAARLHAAVMLYWEQIRRFKEESHMSGAWDEEQLPDGSTLADLADKRLDTVEVSATEWDQDSGREVESTQVQPWVMAPRKALLVHDQLDTCAHKLGFSASPKRQHDHHDLSKWPWEDDIDELPHEKVER